MPAPSNAKPDLLKWIALSTAIMACLCSFITYQSAGQTNRALLLKNEAIMKVNQEANAWAFYQAKNTKLYLVDVLLLSTKDPLTQENLRNKKIRYYKEIKAIGFNAHTIGLSAKKINAEANQLLRPQIRYAQAMNALQIAISIASMAALTKRYWLFILSLISAIMGLMLALIGWLL